MAIELFPDEIPLPGRVLSGRRQISNLLPAAKDLLYGSFLAGMALSIARLGVIHGLVHPLGARYDIPHGLLCAIALPPSLSLNIQAMGRVYKELSELAGDDILKKSEELLDKVGLNQSPLAECEISDRESIIKETLASGSTQANPKTIEREDVEWLLDKIFQPKVL